MSRTRASSFATLALAVAIGLVATACSGETEPVGPWRPVAAETLIDAPDLFYDVSPDGAWVVYEDDDRFCLSPTAGGAPVCTSDADPAVPQIAWAPSGDRVAVLDSVIVTFRPGPLVVVDTDGTVTTVLDPGDDFERTPTSVAFADDDTLIYTTLSLGDTGLSVRRIGIDGSGDELVASFDGESPMTGVDVDRWTFDRRWLLDDESVVSSVVPNRSGAIARLGFDGSVDAVTGPGPRWIPVDAAQGLILIADGAVLSNAADSEGSGFALLDEAGDPRPIPLRPELRARGAVLSPSGESVAMVWTPEADRDSAVMAVATVDSIIAGAPDWQDLAEPLDGFSLDFDGYSTPLVWTEPNTILFEGDPLVRITLEPIG